MRLCAVEDFKDVDSIPTTKAAKCARVAFVEYRYSFPAHLMPCSISQQKLEASTELKLRDKNRLRASVDRSTYSVSQRRTQGCGCKCES